MKISILNPNNNSETFFATVTTSPNNNEITYKVIFDDRRVRERYGSFEITKGESWKIPITKPDLDLLSVTSRIIYEIMEKEESEGHI